MSAKSKFKSLVVIIILLTIAGALAYLSFADVTPQRTQVIKEVTPSSQQ